MCSNLSALISKCKYYRPALFGGHNAQRTTGILDLGKQEDPKLKKDQFMPVELGGETLYSCTDSTDEIV